MVSILLVTLNYMNFSLKIINMHPKGDGVVDTAILIIDTMNVFWVIHKSLLKLRLW